MEQSPRRTWTVVVAGGGPLSPTAVAAVTALGDDTPIIAADSGLDAAIDAGLSCTRLVGDLDSVSASARMWAYAHGVAIDEHPTDKDSTDTELALAEAATTGTDGLLLVGGVGDRIDHLLGTLLALGGATAATFHDVRAIIGDSEFVIVHPHHRLELRLEPGRTFSILALHGPCVGVHLSGAQWDLDGADLDATEARGLSNVAEGTVAVQLDSGILTVVIP